MQIQKQKQKPQKNKKIARKKKSKKSKESKEETQTSFPNPKKKNAKKSGFFTQCFNYLMGTFYCVIHYFYMMMILFIMTFSTRIGDLCFIMIILTLNMVGVVVIRDCPLNLMERKYLPVSCLGIRSWIIQHVLPLNYQCDHKYEKTLEYLLNAWTITGLKCFFLMIWRMVRPFQIVNAGQLYCME
jgi:hypothetical protein